MTSNIYQAAFKSPLLPLVVLFVCTAQVLTLADQHGPNKAHLETIDQFRKEILDCNTKFRSIIRKDGKDEVDKDPARCTKRVLCVAVTAYRSANSRDWADSLTTRYRKIKDLLQKLALIPPLPIDEHLHDILEMDNEFREEKCPNDCHFYKYYKSIRDGKVVEAEKKIKECADSKKVDKQVSLLANYFVPLARKIIYDYDGAISYITRQYEAHCIASQGIVHQYPKYYLLLWWSMLKFDSFYWNEFIATACPIVPFDINGPDSQIGDMEGEDDVETIEPVPEILMQVAVLWNEGHFELLSGTKTRIDLVNALSRSFDDYKSLFANRQEHDDNVWLGYQKKLLAQEAVLRLMDHHVDIATSLLDAKKDKLQDWLRARTSSSGQIPDLLTAAVHHVLSANKLYRETTKSNDILALVLKLAYGQENVYLEPNSVEQPLLEGFKSGLKRNVQIDKVRIFFPQESKNLITHSHLSDSLVRLLEDLNMISFNIIRYNIISFDKFFDQPKKEQDMIMVRLVFALEDIMNLDVQLADEPLLPKPVNILENPTEREQVPIDTHPSQKEEPCHKSTCFRGTIGALIVAGTLYGVYWKFFSQSSDTLSDDYSPTSNSSIAGTSTQSSSGIHFWLMIVTIGLIFALLVIGSLFYLIRCRRRYRGNWLPTISILALTGASLIAYYFLGNLNSKVTLVLCVGAFLVAIFMVGWAACVSKSNGEQHSIKPSKKSSSNLAATSSYLTNESSSGLGGSSSISSSSVASSAASSTAKSTPKVPPQVSSSSVIGRTISFGPTSVNQCLTKSILKATAEGPSLAPKQSPTKDLKLTSQPARAIKSPTRTAPSSTALLITLPKKKASSLNSNPSSTASPSSDGSKVGGSKFARNSSYFTLPSAVTPSTFSSATNVPVAKKTTINSPTRKNSNMKGPSQSAPLPSRVKSPTGKVSQSPTDKDTATTKPGGGDPKGVHKKEK